ncbi:MAG TPA: glycosyltransferase family 4 protein [Geothrix sp.]|nr:glycosyltransferase family 4 protein [Geothrix sp.]
MRVAVFHPAFESVGGAEILAAAQAAFYRDQGVAPDLVTLGYDANRWASRLTGIPIRVVVKRHWTDLFRGWGRIGKLQARGRRAADILGDYDVVVAHNFPASTMLGAAPIRARKIWQCNEPPRGIHLREANPILTARVEAVGGDCLDEATRQFQNVLAKHDRSMGRSSTALARRTFDLASAGKLDQIYAISEFSRDNARRIYGRCDEQVIYPIVRFPQGGRNRQGLERSVRRVLVHSRLEVLKNIDTVIRGFGAFARRSPVPCELHVVGEGPCRERLEALARASCPRDSVTFHGYLSEDDLRRVYEACDAFALLTLDEPFGMVYPEAAAKGLLMVGPDHGGPREILDDGRLGWTIDAFSPDALGEALAEIWSLDDAEVDRRRSAADAACRDRFGMAAIGPKLLSLVGRS